MAENTFDPWQARFAWFWFNSKEIFDFSQGDMDAKVKSYADQGITHLCTFSCTHFRWSFRPWWKEINACLAKIVIAAHKYGLNVIEHHSSCLTYVPVDGTYGQHLEFLRNYLQKHGSALEDWPGFAEYNLDEQKRESTWEQLDAVTGEKISTWYHGHIKCPNNPEYLQEYLLYLKSVYATGVDGIMTDDMQFANQNVYQPNGEADNLLRSCGCSHCRAAFRKLYGYDMPSPEKWDSWFGHGDEQTFADYLEFRRASCLKFHQAIKDHYESLGLKMLRPNYNSTPIQSNPRGTFPGIFPALDWFFQECNLSSIIRASWPRYIVEQQMVMMYAASRNIPHMMLFYADRNDSLIFTFGIAKLLGAIYTNTPEGSQSSVDESSIRKFEMEHSDLLFHSRNHCSIGFLDSEKNRFDSAGYGESRFYFWMQAALIGNLPALLYRLEEPDTWQAPVLVANEIHLMSEADVAALKHYAAEGGTLVLTGICGEQAAAASFRSRAEINALWGFNIYELSDGDSWQSIPYGKGTICIVGYNFGYPGSQELNCRRFVFSEERRKHNSVTRREECSAIGLPRFGAQRERKLDPGTRLFSADKATFEQVAGFLRKMAGDNLTFWSENLPELVLAIPYCHKEDKRFSIQLLNAAGTLPESAEAMVAHDYPIPFPRHTGTSVLCIRLSKGMNVHTVTLHRLEEPASLLVFSTAETVLRITLPLELLSNYAMIEIK